MSKVQNTLITIMLVASLYSPIYGQYKIHLITSEPFGDYEFVNQRDTSLIYTSYKGDMGVHYGAYYDFKEPEERMIAKGRYEVYVDKKLDLVGYFKDNLKDSIWTQYYYQIENNDTLIHIKTSHYKNGKKNGVEKFMLADGEYTMTSYEDGKIEGEYIAYYPSGKVKYNGEVYNHQMIVRTSFYENGKIAIREYFTKYGKLREEFFSKNEKINKITIHQPSFKIEEFDNLELDGKIIIPFYKGKYEVIFNSNKIDRIKMYDDKNNELYSKSFKN